MPLFDFVCNACKKPFETLVLGSERPVCPACGSSDLAKQMSTFAFRSQGPGGEVTSGASKCGGCAGGSCHSCH
ncbi:MAG: zinc ribbon domain-containing protein [Thermodesulfobacteriota bacterium]